MVRLPSILISGLFIQCILGAPAVASPTEQQLATMALPALVAPPAGVCNGGITSEMNRQFVSGEGFGSGPGVDQVVVLITLAIAPIDVKAVIAVARLDDGPPVYVLADVPHQFIFGSQHVGKHSVVVGTIYLMNTGELRQVRVVRSCFTQPSDSR